MALSAVGRRGRVFAILLAGALAAATLSSGQLAAWGDAHADRPGGAAMAAFLHAWNDLLAPLNAPHDWLHARTRAAVERSF